MEPRDHTTWTLSVDGERFEVRVSAGRPGAYDFTWLSGPNPGYGFGIQVHGGAALTLRDLEQEARNFLALVDPGTGHIE